MTVEELLRELEICTTAPRHKCDVCIELIENFRQQEWKKALFAAVAESDLWFQNMPPYTRVGVHVSSTVREHILQIANDPERLAKLIEPGELSIEQIAASFRERVLHRVELCEAELRTNDTENYKRYIARMEMIIKAFDDAEKAE